MLELYTWDTPNGKKPVIMLEELEIDYKLRPVDISTGAQKEPAFKAINPNGRIPAILLDRGADEVRVFESGAILVFLAEKYRRFLPDTPEDRAEVLAWTFWQAAGVGPMMGQLGYFLGAEPPIEHAVERYRSESLRLFDILDEQLAANEWVAGAEYSIADMMLWPWAGAGGRYARSVAEGSGRTFPALCAWSERVGARPAVQRANDKLAALKQHDRG